MPVDLPLIDIGSSLRGNRLNVVYRNNFNDSCDFMILCCIVGMPPMHISAVWDPRRYLFLLLTLTVDIEFSSWRT